MTLDPPARFIRDELPANPDCAPVDRTPRRSRAMGWNPDPADAGFLGGGTMRRYGICREPLTDSLGSASDRDHVAEQRPEDELRHRRQSLVEGRLQRHGFG